MSGRDEPSFNIKHFSMKLNSYSIFFCNLTVKANLENANLSEKLAPFVCQVDEKNKDDNNRSFLVFTRETMPRRNHYSKTERVGDIVLEAVLGTKIFE